jgi:hypothetical protein
MVVLYKVSGERSRTKKQTFEWFSLYIKHKRSWIKSTVEEQYPLSSSHFPSDFEHFGLNSFLDLIQTFGKLKRHDLRIYILGEKV